MDVYEVLDSCGMESVGFREFCAFVILISAVQTGQLLKCLYDHGPLLFDIIFNWGRVVTCFRRKTETSRQNTNHKLWDFTRCCWTIRLYLYIHDLFWWFPNVLLWSFPIDWRDYQWSFKKLDTQNWHGRWKWSSKWKSRGRDCRLDLEKTAYE